MRGKIIHSKEKGLETCSGCGYIYKHIYIHPYGTIVEFRAKQLTDLTKPTKHTKNYCLYSTLTVHDYTIIVYAQENSKGLYIVHQYVIIRISCIFTLYNRIRVDLKYVLSSFTSEGCALYS